MNEPNAAAPDGNRLASESPILIVISMYGGTIVNVRHADPSREIEVVFLEGRKYLDGAEDCFTVGDNPDSAIYTVMESTGDLNDQAWLALLRGALKKRNEFLSQESCDECSGTIYPEAHESHCSRNPANGM